MRNEENPSATIPSHSQPNGADTIAHAWAYAVQVDDQTLRADVAGHRDLSGAARENALTDPTLTVRVAFARRDDLTDAEYARLARDQRVRVMAALASSPTLPVSLARRFVADANQSVLFELVKNHHVEPALRVEAFCILDDSYEALTKAMREYLELLVRRDATLASHAASSKHSMFAEGALQAPLTPERFAELVLLFLDDMWGYYTQRRLASLITNPLCPQDLTITVADAFSQALDARSNDPQDPAASPPNNRHICRELSAAIRRAVPGWEPDPASRITSRIKAVTSDADAYAVLNDVTSPRYAILLAEQPSVSEAFVEEMLDAGRFGLSELYGVLQARWRAGARSPELFCRFAAYNHAEISRFCRIVVRDRSACQELLMAVLNRSDMPAPTKETASTLLVQEGLWPPDRIDELEWAVVLRSGTYSEAAYVYLSQRFASTPLAWDRFNELGESFVGTVAQLGDVAVATV